MLATNSVRPSDDSASAPGYHAVGIRPARRLVSGNFECSPSIAFVPSRTTATQLFVPLATYSVPPSGLSARALEPLPYGSRASGRQAIVSTTSSRPVSITETLSLVALATYRNRPVLLSSRPLGCVPTAIALTD